MKGNYSYQDSVNITNAYLSARATVEEMYNAIEYIWMVNESTEKSIKSEREERWRADENFMAWLGDPIKIGKARRKIGKIHSKFQQEITLQVIKNDESRCGRFVSAWTVPCGKVKRLYQNFVNFNTSHQAKTIIHELGHEAGLLFDRGVYRCRSAKSVAANTNKNRATRRPENYAWLAMSYLNYGCSAR